MPYIKQTWADGPGGGTPLSPSRMTHLETQYDEATADSVSAEEVVITQVSSGWNFKAGHPDNTIAPDVLGSIIAGDGTPGRENVIGRGVIANVNTASSNVPPVAADLLNPDPNTRANHCFVTGYDNVAAGLKSVILGDHSYIREGATHNFIGGGAVHKIDAGDFSSILGGYRNTHTDGDYCTIVGGIDNVVNVPDGGNVTVGGSNHSVTGSTATVFGSQNSATGLGSEVVGVLSKALANYSSARGLQAVARSVGQHAIASGQFAAEGDAQTSVLVQRMSTTNETEGFFGNSYAVPANQSVQYRTLITARETSTGDTKTWELKGAAKRIGSANAVAVGGSFAAATVVSADAGASAWTCRMGASTASIVLFGTGEAGKSIRWVARTELVEVG